MAFPVRPPSTHRYPVTKKDVVAAGSLGYHAT